MKPKLRNEASIDFHYRVVQAAYKAIEAGQFPFQSCINCTNFNKATEICKLVNQRPPAEVIVYGCKEHDDVEQVPF